ncbi:response regulator transcription factor [Sagittula salina]|uniref:Response regulator transcription factor n=1 Tax=Sagittula salina TaxID=2820268 RepID=A0A940MMR8_9RHOB|nr:response regulator transcription factor [Sagittula salina]MBP0482184.1 response regulator transcription factor [Sagittula salina]
MTTDTTAHILVVDDDPEIRRVLRRILEGDGRTVLEAGDVATMQEILDQERVVLVTLDLGLDPGDDLAPARRLRARWNVPVIIITARSAPADRAEGLAVGADDYIVKPFDGREVAIRVARVLERYAARTPASAGAVRVGDTLVDLAAWQVTPDATGETVELTGLETELMALFLARPEQVLSRDDISQALHGRPWSPFDRTIDGHVARLRRKLNGIPDAPTKIRSVRGVGYVLSAPITPVPAWR